jgi:hypothetical protein
LASLRQILRALAARPAISLDEAELLITAHQRRLAKPEETTAERARRERQQFVEDTGMDLDAAIRREAQLERRLGWDEAPPPQLDDWEE